MLVRVRITGPPAGGRKFAVEWDGGGDEREFVVLGNQDRWPSRPGGDAALEAVVRNVRARQPGAGDAVRLGRTLFDAILGEEIWNQILAAAGPNEPIEMRLQWPVGDAVMGGQHWELLHDGTGFLSTSKRRIAVVREVKAPARGEAQPWAAVQGRPPWVLFAVGSELHDTAIRPAAEFLALLRELGRSTGRIPRVRFVEAASVERLGHMIADFDPDVVHLAAHGGAGANGAFVQLRADDGNGSSEVTADQLMPALGAGSSPPLVVLSACSTARVSGLPVGLGMGIAPFATQLVAAGIPAVVGMSGEVTDRTCRLFARRFGSSLVNGAPLALAASDARRAAFQNQDGLPPDTSVDWALPSLFVPDDMPPSFTPVDAAAGTSVRQRIETSYNISLHSDRRPVFAGRLHHIEAFARVVGPTEPCSMLLHGPPGVGVNRLRDELAIFGICEGALLVRRSLSADSYPQNFAMGLLSILLDTSTTRLAHGLRPVDQDGVDGHIASSRLGRAIAQVFGDEGGFDAAITDGITFTNWVKKVEGALPAQFTGYVEEPLTKALLADLAVMRNDIAASSDEPVGPVLLDLPDLDRWGSASATMLKRIVQGELRLPGVDGDDRVRVLATYRDGTAEADEPARLVREHPGPRLAVLSVDPFTPEEERIAIPWVLLHPWGEWHEVIVPQRTKKEDEWYEKYRALTERLSALLAEVQGTPPSPAPVFFMHKAFATAINQLREEHHLVSDEYSDAELLSGLGAAR